MIACIDVDLLERLQYLGMNRGARGAAGRACGMTLTGCLAEQTLCHD